MQLALGKCLVCLPSAVWHTGNDALCRLKPVGAPAENTPFGSAPRPTIKKMDAKLKDGRNMQEEFRLLEAS